MINLAAKIGLSLAMKLAKPAMGTMKQGGSHDGHAANPAKEGQSFNEVYDFMKNPVAHSAVTRPFGTQ